MTDTYTFQPNSYMSNLINEEVKQDAQYHPNLGGITQGGMANHYSMTILSMYGLGATDEQIEIFKQHWPRHRATFDGLQLQDNPLITVDNWQTYLGESSEYLAFRRVFLEKILHRGVERGIYEILDEMKDGLPMGLFHPLIKLSFATMHGDYGLIADALAYMAIRFENLYQHELPVAKDNATELHASDVWAMIDMLKSQGDLYHRLPKYVYGGSIDICEQLVALEGIQDLALGSGWNIEPTTLIEKMKEICLGAVKLYLHEPALTTLHAVTGAQALADLTLRYAIDNEKKVMFAALWKRMFVWLSALYIEKGVPQFAEQLNIKNRDLISWNDLGQLALQSNEVHVIKMTFSCQWLNEHLDDDPHYYQAVVNMLSDV